MRITSKGQVTIPLSIREQLGLLPDTEVEFKVDRDAVRIRHGDRAAPDATRRRVGRAHARTRHPAHFHRRDHEAHAGLRWPAPSSTAASSWMC